MAEHIIDCDLNPLYEDYKIAFHQEQGQFNFDSTKISLYVTYNQEGCRINGHQLLTELSGEAALNACVLDYLLGHVELIPDAWKGKNVCFWGSLYYVSEDVLDEFVRYLYWDGSKWSSSSRCLYQDFDYNWPAIIQGKSEFDGWDPEDDLDDDSDIIRDGDGF